MLESQAKFEAEQLSKQIFTISGDSLQLSCQYPGYCLHFPGIIEYLEGLVKTRLDKKERRKKARFVFKENERQRKLEDVRFREEERLKRRRGIQFVQNPVKRLDNQVLRDEKHKPAPEAAAEEDDVEKPIYPQNIHGGSVSADKLIRSKMVPGDRMYLRFIYSNFQIYFTRLINFPQRSNFGAHRKFDAAISSGFN
jgi:hypothetical protein